MTPYTFTVLADEASLLVFALAAAAGGAYLLTERRFVVAAALLVSSALTAAGLLPVLATLASGGLLSASLPGLSLAETVPWASLAGLTFLGAPRGPSDHRLDLTSFLGFVLALQGLSGFLVGLGLVARRWAAPRHDRTVLVGAITALAAAVAMDAHLGPVRDTVGSWLGLSTDATVWVVHLLVSALEGAGWVALGAHLLGISTRA